jgi:hypothetical protein
MNAPSPAPEGAGAEEARRRRVRQVENAVLSQAFGGHPPSPSAWAHLRRYIEGAASHREGFEELYRHYVRGGPATQEAGPPAAGG